MLISHLKKREKKGKHTFVAVHDFPIEFVCKNILINSIDTKVELLKPINRKRQVLQSSFFSLKGPYG